MSTYSFQYSEYFNKTDFNNVFSALNHSSTYLALVNNEYIAIIPNKNANMKYLNSSVKIYGLNIIWGNPTAVTWITAVHVGVGFSTGIFVCFDSQESNKVIKHYHKCSVKSLFLHSPKYLNSMSNLWLLYEHGFLIMVDVSDILKDELNYIRYKLVNNTHINTFVILPFIYQPLETEYRDNSQNSAASSSYDISFVVAGKEPALSLYNIGGTQHFENINKLAVFLKDRITNTVTKTIGNALFTLFGGVSSPELQLEDQHTAITSTMDFIDQKRDIQRLSLSPDGLLLATSDSLGRVMLFDNLAMLSTLRVWKGNRDARVGWSYNNKKKHLVIYAPRLGLVSLWVLRHGPCLRTISVSCHCHLHTVVSHSSDSGSGEKNGRDSFPSSQCHLLTLSDSGCQLLPIYPHTNHTIQDQDIERSRIHEKDERERNDQFTMEYRELTPLTASDCMDNDSDMNMEVDESNDEGSGNRSSDIPRQGAEENQILSSDNTNDQCHHNSNNNTNITSNTTSTMKYNIYDNLTIPSAYISRGGGGNGAVDSGGRWELWQGDLEEELEALESYYAMDRQTQQELLQQQQKGQQILDSRSHKNRNNNHQQQHVHSQDDAGKERDRPPLTEGGSRNASMDITNLDNPYQLYRENGISPNTSASTEAAAVATAVIPYSQEYEYFERKTVMKILKRTLTSYTTTAITPSTSACTHPHTIHTPTYPKITSSTAAAKEKLSEDLTSIKLDMFQAQILKLFSVIKSAQVLTDTLQILFEFEFKNNLSFNGNFHSKINGIILKIVQFYDIGASTTTTTTTNNNNNNNKVLMCLKGEYELRESLLIAYDTLIKNYIFTKSKTGDSSKNVPPPDDPSCNAAATIPPAFMESHEWLLRLVNNCEKYATSQIYTNNTSTTGNINSSVLYSVGYILNNYRINNEENNNNNNNNNDMKNEISFSFFRTLFAFNADSEPQPNSDDSNTGVVATTDIPAVCFIDGDPVLITDKKSFNCSVILLEILSELHSTQNYSSITSTNSPSPPPPPPTTTTTTTRKTQTLNKDTLHSLLSLICSPLVTGECMSYAIRNAYENMAVGGPLGIFQLLPLLLGYLQLRYSPQEMCALLHLPLASSPLHRWLRDQLLELQVQYQVWCSSHNYSTLLHRLYGADSHQLLAAISEYSSREDSSHSDSPYNHDSQDWGSISVGITFDQIVSRLLLPCYLFIKQSPLLEYNLAFSTILLQILISLQTLLEKRSYGNDILTSTITDFQILVSQLRVCLFLSIPYQYYRRKRSHAIEEYLEYWKKHQLEIQETERQANTCSDIRTAESRWNHTNDPSSGSDVFLSVSAVESGAVNIYSLLAEDTLDFTTHPEQAKLHELKCKQAYVKYNEMIGSASTLKSQPTKGAVAAAAATDPGPLLAWQYSPPDTTGTTSGSGHKVRWLELLQTVKEQDDSYYQSTSTTISPTSTTPGSSTNAEISISSNIGKSDTPQTTTTTTTRSKKKESANISTTTTATATKKSKRNTVGSEKHRRPLLLFFPLHNQMEALTAHRSFLLANKWKSNIEKIKYLSLSCSHLTTAPHLLKVTVGNHICRQVVLPVLQCILLQLDSSGSPTHSRSKEEGAQLEKGSADMVGVVSSIIDELVAVSMELLQLSDQLPLLYSTSTTSTASTTSTTRVTSSTGTWPAVSDPLFGPLVTAASLCLKESSTHPATPPPPTTTAAAAASTANDSGAASIATQSPSTTLAAPPVPSTTTTNDNTSASSLSGAREKDKTYKNQIIEILLLLKLSCHNNSLLDWTSSHGGKLLRSLPAILNPTTTTTTVTGNTSATTTGIKEGRLTFIRNSIVTVIGPPAKSILLDDIYQLAQLWGFSYDAISVLYVELLLAELRRMPIRARQWDETVENTITKISSPNLFLKTVKMLIVVLRNYCYYLLHYMERQVKYGVLIASLDLEAVLWIQDALKHTDESNIWSVAPDSAGGGDLSQTVGHWLHAEESNGQERLTHIITLLQYVQSRLRNISDMYQDIQDRGVNDSGVNSDVATLTTTGGDATRPTTTAVSRMEKIRGERMEIESLLLVVQALLSMFGTLTSFLSKL